jgi:uncharacterized membrane protein
MSKNIITELPELVEKGLLNQETADNIKVYYQQKDKGQGESRMNIVFAIIGTILVGLGIILIVAHNWDDLSRPVKLFFSFLPVITGQILCGFMLYKKSENVAWRESASCFLFFAAGACLALVSQVYHLPEDINSFIFTWLLLVFPLIYIMRSSMASLLYIIGITCYALYDGYAYSSAETYHYWWMLILVLPHYFMLSAKKPASNFTFFHHWFIPISLTICLGTLTTSAGDYMFIAYMSMFGAFYILGTSAYFSGKKIFSNGYLAIGSLGTMSLLLALSFRWFWMELADEKELHNALFNTPESFAMITCTFIAISLLIRYIRNRAGESINPMGFIFLGFIVLFFIGFKNPLLATILTNLMVLAAAIFTINRGSNLNHLGILNYGLLIITVLVICRFFDTNISFVLRGLMFIGVGAGFFIANSRILKKRKQHEQ